MTPPTNRSLTWSPECICSDCFILLGPESAVTIGKDMWFGCRHVAKCWEQSILRCSSTLRTFASVCRWSIGVIIMQPVTMRMAEFWMVCNLDIELGLAFGNQIGAA